MQSALLLVGSESCFDADRQFLIRTADPHWNAETIFNVGVPELWIADLGHHQLAVGLGCIEIQERQPLVTSLQRR